MKKIVIITGYLAGGKSTFARKLSKDLSIPCFIKDTFKIALCENISVTSKEDKSRFSIVTFDAMMYVTERLMETGFPIIIEGNFVPKGIKPIDEAGVIKALVKKYGYQALIYKFVGDTRILCERFNKREKLPERGAVNQRDCETTFEIFNTYCHNLDAFDAGGKTVMIDTTDFVKVDFERHIKTARMFIDGVE